MNNVCTIREAVSRLRTDGLPISEYCLRAWIRSGAFPVRRIGRKALVFYPGLVEFVQSVDSPATNEPMESGKIRRLEVQV